ncbi:MAG TPA: ABC transporter ATP-binding protein [Candidatus Ornithospirochaeta avicola]|uniref:ABC transporter ATP-binding protein n=1 Tax=Candidatus Ornithospirochaeta avicola TaxID=2840896 RepID=A0A9D1PUI6_9SPIO|nr:ABC transporter ATP-binding protein [Candidatus Ornithospirochaeta avicola]
MRILETEHLTREFGGVVAVFDVNFKVEEGMVNGLIGPNGAGKTTLFNQITGVDKPTKGKIIFDGKDITGLPAWKISRLGIARTFQNIRLYKELTVVENVMMGLHFKVGKDPFKGRFAQAVKSYFTARKENREVYQMAMEELRFFDLEDVANEFAGSLPYGRQRELEIARAIASRPRILFLDEPAAGMNPSETAHLMSIINRIRESGITVVLIEHDMKLVMNVCDQITVLSFGQKIAEGTPEEIRNNQQVIEAYLGREEDYE